jgi:hypothetical protein
MHTDVLRRFAGSYPALCLTALWLTLGISGLSYAHSGTPLAAPIQVSSSISIDGTIDAVGTETVWGPGVPVAQLPNNCNELHGMPPAQATPPK